MTLALPSDRIAGPLLVNYRRNLLAPVQVRYSLRGIIFVMIPDKRFSDPRISIAKQNCLIIVDFPFQSAPSSEFLCLYEPFPDIADTSLLDVGMSQAGIQG